MYIFFDFKINPYLLQNNEMSSFKHKLSEIKQKMNHQSQSHQNPQTIQIVKECCNNQKKQELSFQQPIIIEKKTIVKSESQVIKKTKNVENEISHTRKRVQPWVPINIPPRQKRVDVENIQMHQTTTGGNKEIQIQIEKDDKNKDCLKKLFKKIRKLQDELKQSEKQRMRFSLELENYKNKTKFGNDQDKNIAKLQAENYRLSVDLDLVKRLMKERDDQIARLNTRVPKEIIKEVIVQKPVEVIVEVPKFVPGPERIVQKIVQVPKYIQVQKKVPVDVPREVIRQVIRTVQIPVPTIVEKPVYIQKPIYIDRIVQKIVQVPVNVPVQVPIEYPVYIQKAVVQEQWLHKMRSLESSYETAVKDNIMLANDNQQLRIRVSQLAENLQILRFHNEQKNRQIEYLFQNNSLDFAPISPNVNYHQDQSLGSVKYSISSNPHHRII